MLASAGVDHRRERALSLCRDCGLFYVYHFSIVLVPIILLVFDSPDYCGHYLGGLPIYWRVFVACPAVGRVALSHLLAARAVCAGTCLWCYLVLVCLDALILIVLGSFHHCLDFDLFAHRDWSLAGFIILRCLYLSFHWALAALGVRTLAAFGRLRRRCGHAPAPFVAVWPPCILLARCLGGCAVLGCLWSVVSLMLLDSFVMLLDSFAIVTAWSQAWFHRLQACR